MCGNGSGPVRGQKQVLLLYDYRIFTKETICPSKFTVIMQVLITGFSHRKQIEFQSNTFLNCCYMDVCSLDETKHHCPQTEQHQPSPSTKALDQLRKNPVTWLKKF